MRKFLFTITATLLIVATAAAQSTVRLQKKWGMVIRAIEQVESEGRTNITSRDGKYVGCLQISEILVRECNQIVGEKRFSYDDRLSRAKSHEMFIVYQEHFNPDGNMEKAIRLWNSGDLRCMTCKSRTEGYYRRVMSKFDQLARN